MDLLPIAGAMIVGLALAAFCRWRTTTAPPEKLQHWRRLAVLSAGLAIASAAWIVVVVASRAGLPNPYN